MIKAKKTELNSTVCVPSPLCDFTPPTVWAEVNASHCTL